MRFPQTSDDDDDDGNDVDDDDDDDDDVDDNARKHFHLSFSSFASCLACSHTRDELKKHVCTMMPLHPTRNKT